MYCLQSLQLQPSFFQYLMLFLNFGTEFESLIFVEECVERTALCTGLFHY